MYPTLRAEKAKSQDILVAKIWILKKDIYKDMSLGLTNSMAILKTADSCKWHIHFRPYLQQRFGNGCDFANSVSTSSSNAHALCRPGCVSKLSGTMFLSEPLMETLGMMPFMIETEGTEMHGLNRRKDFRP